MRLNSRALLLLVLSGSSVGTSFGFSIPSRKSGVRLLSAEFVSDHDVYKINRKLDELAEQCGDAKKPVVAIASEVEDIYHASEKKDLVSFNVLLKAWGRTCQSLERQKYIHYDVHEKLSTTSIPSVAVYTPRDAAEHLTKHLMEAEASYEKDPDGDLIYPDETSYNIAIDAWAKISVPDSTEAAERLLKKMINNPRLEPCLISYNSVLDSHAHSSDVTSLKRMNKIWQHMQNLAEDGNKKVKPNLRTANLILTACVRMAERLEDVNDKMACAEQARALLEDMKKRVDAGAVEFTPDITTYSIVMDVYARVGIAKSALKAEDLMKEIKEVFQETGDCRRQPNVRTYTTLIGAWSRTTDTRAAARAESLVEEMEELYAERMAKGTPLKPGEETTKPNARTFTTVLHAISRSRDHGKAKRALRTLMKMRELAKTDPDCTPTIGAYNQAIDACAKSRGDQVEALKIAFAILKTVEMDENVKPIDHTYSNTIKTVAFLLPTGSERNKLALAVFEKAKKDGMVSGEVMKNMRKALDADAMHELLSEDFSDNQQVPHSWNKNVRRR
mmetsp:Transcript_32052/g.48743  ORF Transcript_32052/g.48743 Transcript_32052/m.48743 type:complete len:559 (+) Transcript_32052:161-1837(+)